VRPERELCLCGYESSYPDHCAIVHETGAGLGVSAESLMRARYSAYVLHRREFLLSSWHPDTRPEQLEFDPALTWLGLEIVDTKAGSGLDTTGVVEFKARFERGGRIDGRWVYVDGE